MPWENYGMRQKTGRRGRRDRPHSSSQGGPARDDDTDQVISSFTGLKGLIQADYSSRGLLYRVLKPRHSGRGNSFAKASCPARLVEGEDITKKVSMAKAWLCEMANRVAYRALQIHGGYG